MATSVRQQLERLGIATISTDGMELREGQNGPSLWLPRFDVRRHQGRELRLGVESMSGVVIMEAGIMQMPGSFATARAWRAPGDDGAPE